MKQLAAATICAVLLVTLLLWSWSAGVQAPHKSGVIDVASGETAVPAPLPARGIGPPRSDPGQAAVPTDPATLYMRLRAEDRDSGWAALRETTIAANLRTVPYVGRGLPLEVKCATTLCEVTGVAAAGAPLEEVQRAWRALELASRSNALAREGLVPVASTFGTGRSMHAFVLYYERAGNNLFTAGEGPAR